jgi:carbon-monoxide dehydrogenase medium subunit
VADAVLHAIEPGGDIHATAEYRAMLAVELSREALAQAATNALALQRGSQAERGTVA